MHHPPSPPAETPRVVVLGADRTFVHVYPDQGFLHRENDIGYGDADAVPFPVEFFSETGEPLAAQFDQGWRVCALAPCAAADPDRLHVRLLQAVAALRHSFAEAPDRLALYGMSTDDALGQLAEAADLTSLRELVDLFEFDHEQLNPGLPGEFHSRGFLHNWWKH